MMLKIRDGVDLKELENFGFMSEFGCFVKYDFRQYWTIVVTKKRVVEVANRFTENQNDIDNEFNNRVQDLGLATLYDLIKADLVEKVIE